MRWLVAALLALLPALVQAQGLLPGLYRVAGVAADDVLNIRSGPGVEYPIIGAFSPYAVEIEVTGESADFRWLRVNTPEATGWAAARYLRHMGPDWSAGLPARLRCGGTEPFWGFDIDGAIATWSDPSMGTEFYDAAGSGPVAGRIDIYAARYSNAGGRITLFLQREECSDGMSDRTYGLSILLLRETGAVGAHAGCCSIAP